jgi:hypothetical protein
MSATAQPIAPSPSARRLLVVVAVALVLAVTLIVIGSQLVMSANPASVHGVIPGLDHSGGLYRFQFPR